MIVGKSTLIVRILKTQVGQNLGLAMGCHPILRPIWALYSPLVDKNSWFLVLLEIRRFPQNIQVYSFSLSFLKIKGIK